MKERTSRISRKEFSHLKEWCGEHLWAAFMGVVGSGWDIIKKYIVTQDTHHAKPVAISLVHYTLITGLWFIVFIL